MDFDETRLYYTHQQLQRNTVGVGQNNNNDNNNQNNNNNNDDESIDLDAIRRHFREFLRTLPCFVCHRRRRRRCCSSFSSCYFV
jgi:hypothetical protein